MRYMSKYSSSLVGFGYYWLSSALYAYGTGSLYSFSNEIYEDMVNYFFSEAIYKKEGYPKMYHSKDLVEFYFHKPRVLL